MKAKVLKSRSIFVAAILGVVLGGAAANAQAQRPGQASSSKQQPNAQANGKKYVFTLESFQILNTRALHNDTDHVSFALKVGNTVYPAKVKHMGNKNNGTYKVALSFGPIDVPSRGYQDRHDLSDHERGTPPGQGVPVAFERSGRLAVGGGRRGGRPLVCHH